MQCRGINRKDGSQLTYFGKFGSKYASEVGVLWKKKLKVGEASAASRLYTKIETQYTCNFTNKSDFSPTPQKILRAWSKYLQFIIADSNLIKAPNTPCNIPFGPFFMDIYHVHTPEMGGIETLDEKGLERDPGL